MEESCLFYVCDFQEIPGTFTGVKKGGGGLKRHRLGVCYNFGIYIYMFKDFLLLFVLLQLFSALEQLRFDEKVRVVVFKSEVKGIFCAGR